MYLPFSVLEAAGHTLDRVIGALTARNLPPERNTRVVEGNGLFSIAIG